MIKKDILISVDSIFDTRAFTIKAVMNTTDEYLVSKGWQIRESDSVAQLSSRQLKFYYDLRDDMALRKSKPCNISPLLLNTKMVVKNKKLNEDIHEEVTLDVNLYPYTDVYAEKIRRFLSPYEFEIKFINTRPSLELYSVYDFIIDYEGLEVIQDPYIMAHNKVTAPSSTLFCPALNSGLGKDENFDFLLKYCEELTPIIQVNPLDVALFSF